MPVHESERRAQLVRAAPRPATLTSALDEKDEGIHMEHVTFGRGRLAVGTMRTRLTGALAVVASIGAYVVATTEARERTADRRCAQDGGDREWRGILATRIALAGRRAARRAHTLSRVDGRYCVPAIRPRTAALV